MKKYLILCLVLVLAVVFQNGVNADDISGTKIAAVAKKNKKLDAQVETRRIPKGARMKVKLLDPVGTKTSQTGEMFNSMLITDKTVDNAMILPAGTLIRGYV